MPRPLYERFVALAILFHVLCGCSSSSGSGTGSGGGSGGSNIVEIEFGSSAQDWSEDAGHASVPITLSTATPSAVFLPYTLGGTAVEGQHYVIDHGPLEVPAQVTFTSLLVGILADLALFDSDVELVVTLQPPTGAVLGAGTVHTLRILNDALFDEFEPNNNPDNANPLDGQIGPGRAGTVRGQVTPVGEGDARDAFLLMAEEATLVESLLVPESGAADVSFWFSRLNGTVLEIVDQGGAGETERGEIFLEAGQSVLVTVATTGASTNYELGLSGIGSGNVTMGVDGGGDPLVRLGLDWDSVLRLWSERKRALPSGGELIGGGTALDLATGSARTFELRAAER